MEEISISKFKATCFAVLEKVRLTGQPIRVTRHGKVVAEIVPPDGASGKKFQLGGMEGKLKVTGDISNRQLLRTSGRFCATIEPFAPNPPNRYAPPPWKQNA